VESILPPERIVIIFFAKNVFTILVYKILGRLNDRGK
jgi:hypothetical protein